MDHKELWAALAAGEVVEARGYGGAWHPLSAYSGGAIIAFVRPEFDEQWEFRIKPKTVKIGNREIEAPVMSPSSGQKVYAVWPDGMQSEWKFRRGDVQHEKIAAAGFFYSTQDAANAAREAITALLTGKE